ncbi:MAG TPA: prephenate dehydrogenase/arogenate dehydrogenase family protein [Dehalococcoidia bacterium]
MRRIAIIGTGLIGASIGLGLKAAAIKDLDVVGYDKARGVAATARKRGALDREARSAAAAVEGAGLVIVATPVRAMRDVFQEIAPHLAPGAVVTDVGSTKSAVMAWAAELLPETVHFVGGHPMAGKEQSGPEAAEADLFRGKAYCVVPSPSAAEAAVQNVVGLAETLGAAYRFMEAQEHDQYVAAVSHVPFIASAALFSMARGSAAWYDLAPLAGPGFRDVTRLASGDPVMERDICLTNREAIIHWLDRLVAELAHYRELIQQGDPEELLAALGKVQELRDRFMAGLDMTLEEGKSPVELPSASDQIKAALFGGYMVDAQRRLRELTEQAEQGDNGKRAKR